MVLKIAMKKKWKTYMYLTNNKMISTFQDCIRKPIVIVQLSAVFIST